MTLYFVRITEKNGEYEYGTPCLIRAENEDDAAQQAQALVRQWRGDGTPWDEGEPDGAWEFGDGLIAELDGVTALHSLADLERTMSVLEPERCEADDCSDVGWRLVDGSAYCREHDPK